MLVLRPLAAGQPHRGGLHRRIERGQRVRVAGQQLAELRRQPLALGHDGGVTLARGGAVRREPHALDGGQRELRLGLPRLGPEVPLVRPAGAERLDERRRSPRGSAAHRRRRPPRPRELLEQAGACRRRRARSCVASRRRGARGPRGPRTGRPSRRRRCRRGGRPPASGSSDRRRDGADRPGAERRTERRPDVVLEHLLQVRREAPGPGQQAGVGQRGEVRSLAPGLRGQVAVGVELGDRDAAHDPRHRLAELRGVALALVPRLLLVGRHLVARVEVGVVDGRRARRRACERPSAGPGRGGCRSSRRTGRRPRASRAWRTRRSRRRRS